MRRRHLFEIVDQLWCPNWLRDAGTDYLATLFAFLGMADAVGPRLIDALRRSGSRRIVDLCSGAGGPLPGLVPRLEEAFDDPIEVFLTDLRPNRDAMERFAANSAEVVPDLSAPPLQQN